MTDRRATRPSSPGTSRIAVLDADSGFVHVLGKRLDAGDWHYELLASPVPLEAIAAMRVNAVLLDLSLLGSAAWSYLESLCARMPQLGVVICTAPAPVAQRVRGLRLGADDWVTKPCHPEEVIARVEAVIRRRRRAEARAEGEPVLAGELEVRADQFQVFATGRCAELTRREFELIQLLASSAGHVLPREEIYERVWGYTMVHGDRSVDVFIRKLRQKLERVSPDWRYIHTHFGIGYRFEPAREDSVPAVAHPTAGGPLDALRARSTVRASEPHAV